MKTGSQCPSWHVPPKYDSMIADAYSRCEAFCVVRHPESRFRSEHMWRIAAQREGHTLWMTEVEGEEACSTAALSRAARDHVSMALENPFKDMCHMLPQADYVNEGKSCQYVLRYESLESDFNKLMDKLQIKTIMDKHTNPSTPCNASYDDSSRDMLRKFFASDYQAFGYK